MHEFPPADFNVIDHGYQPEIPVLEARLLAIFDEPVQPSSDVYAPCRNHTDTAITMNAPP
jgi:hypothetical protein